MALICDICKTRPATARVAFMVNGQQRIVDVCAEDFAQLQSGNQEVLAQLSDGIAPQTEQFTKRLVKESADIAAQFGQHEIGTEHILIALADDEVAHSVFEALNIRPEDIKGFITVNAYRDVRHTDRVSLSPHAKEVISEAHELANNLSSTLPGPEHILLALVDDEGMAGTLLRRYGVTEERLRTIVREQEDRQRSETETPLLNKYGRDMTMLAQEGKLDPVIGRNVEVETLIEVLSRRNKNNPVLIGEPGVGKTAIVEGLAQRIHANNVPKRLQGKRLIEISLNNLVAGSKYRGEFEERMQQLLEEVVENQQKVVLFIDELHTIVGTGSTEGGLDAANVFKPALARGELHLIGATTLDEYQKHIEKDSALERRFQPITVKEPTVPDTVAILHGLRTKYEEHHRVTISDDAIQAAATLSDRYLTQRFLPDKAVDLIDQASSRARIKADTEQSDDPIISAKDIADVLATLTGIPVSELTQEEKQRLLTLESRLHQRIIGQEQAVRSVASAVRVSRAGLTQRHSPIATFLFLGPTGVGKTELAKALAEELFGTEESLIRIDMSEYMEKHAVSRLIGSPPGYVGYDEGGQLTEAVRRRPFSVILLDEIEKAHPDVANVLLQLFDDGRLTDGKGRTVDFSNTVIIATSNLGTELSKQTRIGFNVVQEDELKEDVIEKLRLHFRPEFINRLDEVVAFHPLNESQIEQIVELQLKAVGKRLADAKLSLKYNQSVVKHFALVGFDERFGARELKRKIKVELENKIASAILDNRYPEGSVVKASIKAGDVNLT